MSGFGTADIGGNFLRGQSSAMQIMGAQKAQQQSFVQGRQNNALRDYTQQNAAALMAGDANAIAGYAAIAGPEKALKLQEQVSKTTTAEKAIKLSDAQLKKIELEAEAVASKMSAAELKAQTAETDREIRIMSGLSSAEEWDAFARSEGQEKLIGQFHNKEAWLQADVTSLDVLKRLDAQNAPAVPLSPPGKVQADINSGILPEGTSLRSKGQSKAVYGTDGNLVYSEGGTPPKMTVDAAKNAGFYIRTQNAEEVLQKHEEQGLNFGQQIAGNAPLGLGNFVRTPEFQQYDQARRDFVNAVLRRESGAVIADSEFENANQQYFPVPGDGPEVIAQKRENRKAAIEGIKMGAGEGGAYVDAQGGPSEVKPEVAPNASGYTFQNEAQQSIFEKYSQ